MSPLEPDVERQLARAWPSLEEQRAARPLIHSYAGAELDRVRLAMIKLSQGSLDRLQTLSAQAKVDYRDLLLWAEYPEQGRAQHLAHAPLSLAERKELRAIHARDRAQYEAWLKA